MLYKLSMLGSMRSWEKMIQPLELSSLLDNPDTYKPWVTFPENVKLAFSVDD